MAAHGDGHPWGWQSACTDLVLRYRKHREACHSHQDWSPQLGLDRLESASGGLRLKRKGAQGLGSPQNMWGGQSSKTRHTLNETLATELWKRSLPQGMGIWLVVQGHSPVPIWTWHTVKGLAKKVDKRKHQAINYQQYIKEESGLQPSPSHSHKRMVTKFKTDQTPNHYYLQIFAHHTKVEHWFFFHPNIFLWHWTSVRSLWIMVSKLEKQFFSQYFFLSFQILAYSTFSRGRCELWTSCSKPFSLQNHLPSFSSVTVCFKRVVHGG